MRSSLKKVFKNRKLLFYLTCSQINNFFFIKFSSFTGIIAHIEKPISNQSISTYNIYDIVKYQAKISKILMINQCLISAITLKHAFQKSKIKSSLVIGIKKSNTFKSHAWVETKYGNFLCSNPNEYEKILEIN